MSYENQEILKQQINAHLEDEDFCAAFFQIKDPTSATQMLAQYGIETTESDVAAIASEGLAALVKMENASNDELDDAALESVAGGGKWRRFFRGLGAVAVGAPLAFIGGIACSANPALTPLVYKAAVGYSFGAAAWIANG